ncbi:LPXTG cell wall anchor domain-containing protein [Fructobacillus tropaeoli]|uniref:Extracellular matrix binding protein n=1 Tax=Fructobacillus tropaeoli TaxID=709323 RepID=A0A3F3H027_9LACO|nr:LPXTG cell wall anchor domain-containing protein [Fructobacillus tropaeoli]GAP03527.1 extracellular matrix binding protein [Fructobacillus tropaeoli]
MAGKPLPDRQEDAEKALQTTADAAKSNLDAQVAQANNDINNNNYLTDAQKAAQKQAQNDAVDVALKQAVIDVDNGQDVPTVNGIPDGSTAVKEINQGHVTATKTPTQQEEDLNAQIDDQASKVKADVDADVTLKAAEKAAQKHTIDSFVAETKAKIAGLTKYQDRLDVVNQALDAPKNLHQQGKPLAEHKSDAIAAIDQKAAQIRTQIANDSRLTQAQKEVDYQLVADAVAKAKAQVNAALNADEIAAGLDYGTVQLEAAYQQKVQEQYAEKQPTTPETVVPTVKTAPVLPQTGETEKNHEGALVAEALVASVAGFFLSKVNKRRQDEK